MSKKNQKKTVKKTLKLNGNAVTTDNVECYRSYRSVLQHCKRAAKQTYYHNQCVKSRKNTKGLWSVINEIVKKKSNKMQTIECLNINNIQETNSLLIANEFGRYFSQFANKIGHSKTPITEYIRKIPSNSDMLFLAPTNALEIQCIIAQLPSKPSSGHDDISNILLKKLSECIVAPLVSILITQCRKE